MTLTGVVIEKYKGTGSKLCRSSMLLDHLGLTPKSGIIRMAVKKRQVAWSTLYKKDQKPNKQREICLLYAIIGANRTSYIIQVIIYLYKSFSISAKVLKYKYLTDSCKL